MWSYLSRSVLKRQVHEELAFHLDLLAEQFQANCIVSNWVKAQKDRVPNNRRVPAWLNYRQLVADDK